MKLGVIGGSGLYELDGLTDVERREIHTPFGDPSDVYVAGRLAGRELTFLPRHGRGHRLLPSEINHRANVYGFKTLGVEAVLSVSAVGSLKEELAPRDVVFPDQYFDRTKRSSEHTFMGGGLVGHVGFGDPACAALRALAAGAAREVAADAGAEQVKVCAGGTYVCMEGPAFSTRAESNVYRSFGFDVIGMTSLGEAKLCREAGICYQAMSFVTDYDCWRESEESVNVEAVLEHLHANTALAKRILAALAAALPDTLGCDCAAALKNALITQPDAIPESVRRDLALLL
jgi:5'-methylthioadenosine phosphorylase